MAIDVSMEPMLDAFIYETVTLLEQLDEIMLRSEKSKDFDSESIGEIFRIMHTIKGSSAMMGLTAMSEVAHAVEDIFFIVREHPEKSVDTGDDIFDLVFTALDFLKDETDAVRQTGDDGQNPPDEIIRALGVFAARISGKSSEKQSPAGTKSPPGQKSPPRGDCHQIRVFFEDDCRMENLRAFMILSQLRELCEYISSDPENPETGEDTAAKIISDGFTIFLIPAPGISFEEIRAVIESAVNIKTYDIIAGPDLPASSAQKAAAPSEHPQTAKAPARPAAGSARQQSFISVNRSKLDQLMDLVGELVTTESMVIGSPDLRGLELDNFNKSARELRKITDELQDVVMSVRMVPLEGVFQKMNRIVRDMAKKLDKQAELITVGGETEVDKTINEAIVDPVMHMVRNAVDHAIEDPEERIRAGKPECGKVTISAKNIGGEIVLTISDDGRGLDSEKLLAKASAAGLLNKPESEYTDREIYGFIMHAGFSTNKAVTEFSGRGVGMDVVRQNLQKVGGSIYIDSQKGTGTVFTIKIPLTLAIVDGMELKVGDTVFTIPITSIRRSFKVSANTRLLRDTEGREMIMLRGVCYPVIRLHEIFDCETPVTTLEDGIMVQIESGDNIACIFADELIGEQQVVVKPFPAFLKSFPLKRAGLSGCTILGDGNISLILDASGLVGQSGRTGFSAGVGKKRGETI